MSKILDVLTAPWAIQPEKLVEIQSIYATHLRGDKIDIKAIEAQIGRPLDNKPKPYTVIDGVAVLPLFGVISKRMNLFSAISSGVSTEMAIRDFNTAMEDDSVRAIVLQIDSPGGTVDGTQALADLVYQARGVKRVVALADGLMASAAYWIASAAENIYMTDDTTHVGSIGVVTSHTDISGAEAKSGRKTTEIYAGKYKRIDSNYEPLTDAGKSYLQEQVDYIYSVFVDAVARNRNASVNDVLKNMADGRIFIGQQAIDAGLVDGVSTLDELIADLSQQDRAGVVQVFAAGQSHANSERRSDMKITMEMVKAEAPEVAQAIHAEAKKEFEADHAQAIETVKAEALGNGAAAERERIQAVKAQSMPGHEALIETMMFDGTTTGEQAAVAVLKAERGRREQMQQAMDADASAADVPFAPAPAAESAQDLESAPIEERAKAEWDRTPSIRGEFPSYETYLAFRKAEASGQVRRLSAIAK